MNYAEQRRNVRIAGMDDLELVEIVIKDSDSNAVEVAMASSMRAQITDVFGEPRGCLTKKQRAWAEEIARRVTPISANDVPKGLPVDKPAVLQKLPMKPPRRIVP